MAYAKIHDGWRVWNQQKRCFVGPNTNAAQKIQLLKALFLHICLG